MPQPESGSLQPVVPAWLRALAGVALVAICAAAAYAVAIGLINLPSIGV